MVLWLLAGPTNGLGRHQLNIPHPAGWTAIQKGAAGRVAPDLWHNLPDDEWKRLQLLQVPWKLMKSQATHDRGSQQYLLAKQLAVQRAHREQPKSLEQELVIEDQLHLEVYMTAAKRISKMLQDKEHYMNGKLEPVPDSGPKETKKKPPQGRLALLRQLTLRERQPGTHEWEIYKAGDPVQALQPQDKRLCDACRDCPSTGHSLQRVLQHEPWSNRCGSWWTARTF